MCIMFILVEYYKKRKNKHLKVFTNRFAYGIIIPCQALKNGGFLRKNKNSFLWGDVFSPTSIGGGYRVVGY